ncbi:MAG TPA: peptidoglycan DD-metalloendopeptidase family protein [Actinomycetota bacterium]
MAGLRNVRVSPVRRGVLAALVLVLATATLGSASVQSTTQQLQSARDKLHSLQQQVDSQRSQLAALQKESDVLAGQVTEAFAKLDAIKQKLVETEQRQRQAQQQYDAIRARLDARARQAYENGPASSIDVLLGASSMADLSDRLEFMGAVSQDDADLARSAQNLSVQLQAAASRLETLQQQQQKQADAYQAKYDALKQKQQEQQALYDNLSADRQKAEQLVTHLSDQRQAELKAQAAAIAAAAQAPIGGTGTGGGGGGTVVGGPGPFFSCPVPAASYTDSFGAPRYAGGYHPHAGNDLLAPMGSPIHAPFDGVATQDNNTLGGLSVIVHGAQGYVYNAHMSRIGQLGSVHAGDVIGYVGNTGDAAGGPTHDHFEWHPNSIPPNPYTSPYGLSVIGDAIDPFPYLNEVC